MNIKVSKIKLVSEIIEMQSFNNELIWTKVEFNEKLNFITVDCNNSSHLQSLLSSIINIESVYLKEYTVDKYQEKCRIELNIY